jgi:hypothetical protein
MGDPTSSYATAGIALRVSGALKPHHHDKVETTSVGLASYYFIFVRSKYSPQCSQDPSRFKVCLLFCCLTKVLISSLYSVHDTMINEYGAVGGIRIDSGNRSTSRKPIQVPP